MRQWIICLAVLIGCAPSAGDDANRIRAALTPARLAAIDVPILLVEAPEIGVAASLLLVGRNGDVTTWQARDGVQLSLQDGLVVATRGFGHDVMSSDLRGVQRALVRRGGNYRRQWSEPGGDFTLVFHEMDCVMAGVGQVRNSGPAGPKALMRLNEACDGPVRPIQNQYDIGPDGFVWRSVQWVTPQIGSLRITVMKR